MRAPFVNGHSVIPTGGHRFSPVAAICSPRWRPSFLPALVSQAGGQNLQVVIGLQDLSQARARWAPTRPTGSSPCSEPSWSSTASRSTHRPARLRPLAYGTSTRGTHPRSHPMPERDSRKPPRKLLWQFLASSL